MDILVITNSCSAEKYNEICKMRKTVSIDPQQKFFRLMISGLKQANNGKVEVFAALPVSASSVTKRRFSKEEDMSEEGVVYTYYPFYNGKVLRYVTLVISSWRFAKKWCKGKSKNDPIVVVDPLIPIVAIPTRIVAQRKGIKVAAVVTDIPSLTTKMKGRKEGLLKRLFLSIYQRIADKDLKSYDAYIPLTESINEVGKTKQKPKIVIEGFCDSTDTSISNHHKSIVMYAGGIYVKYGIKNLVEAFAELNRHDVSLLLFGDGPYVKELHEIEENHSNIKYMGCISPEEVVKYEKEALLLVNPRPTNEEFAKYSFPSKTMEYMLSGTAVVSTRLPGIPDEYFEYMYSFSGDDKNSIKSGLNQILSINREELIHKGTEAHFFVLNNKNNVIQAKRIVEMLRSIL